MSKKIHSAIHSAILIEPVVVGKIGSAYGIYGWLRLLSSTEQVAEKIFAYQPWFIKSMSKWQNIVLEKWKRHNNNLIIKLRNINDREAAMLLINCEIVIDGSQLPELDSGEYYWKDIFGCCVVTVNGYQLGKVINIIETGSNDVLVVKGNFKQDDVGIKELLIPFLEGQVIKNVDLSVRIIKVDWDPSF